MILSKMQVVIEPTAPIAIVVYAVVFIVAASSILYLALRHRS
jgi:hypothetical protein